MIKIKREFKIGVLLAGALFIFIWGINYLRGTDIFSKHINFYVVYDDVSGLIETNPVSLSGVQIGHIDKIFLHPDGSGNVIVKCIVEDKIKIPDNSLARLYSSSLVGTREIDLMLGNSKSYIENGDTLNAIIQPPLQDEISEHLIPLKENIDNVLLRTDTILKEMSHLFSYDNRKNITKSIKDLQKSMASIKQLTYIADETFHNNSEKFSSIIHNAESISNNLKENNEAITHIFQNLESITDTIRSSDIAKTINNANKSLDSFNKIMEKINRGEGSAGLLLKDDSLYKNLSRSSRELELLLEDVRKNPKKYINISVFGK